MAAHSTLPRFAAALLSGAALGLTGALLQQALRNPLASPGTLGISAGAHLSLAAASLYAPGLLAAAGRDGVAFCGGAGAVASVLVLTWRGGLALAAVVLGPAWPSASTPGRWARCSRCCTPSSSPGCPFGDRDR